MPLSAFESFTSNVPVLGVSLGFPGTVSRSPTPDIAARQVLPTTPNNLNFGSPCVIIPDAKGGTLQSVSDFIAASAANAALVATQFGGFACREVQTVLSYPQGQTPGTPIQGYYYPGQMAEAIEKGSVTVNLAAGTPLSQGAVYVRVAPTSSNPALVVGDIEAAADTPVSTTGTASSGSTALTVASGTGIYVGQFVTGAGIAANTVVTAVLGTSVTLSQNTTAALSATPVSFVGTLVLPNTVFRTGYVDPNTNAVEITMKIRVAA